MRVNAYRVLDEAVERGVARGWRKAHKHEEQPEAQAVQDAIWLEVMNEVSEYFSFDEAAVHAE